MLGMLDELLTAVGSENKIDRLHTVLYAYLLWGGMKQAERFRVPEVESLATVRRALQPSGIRAPSHTQQEMF
jgi:hypothetical protein